MSSIVEELRGLIGNDAVLDPGAIAERASSYWDPSPMRAAALARPRTTEELSAVMRFCFERGQPVITHGGLSGCVSGTVSSLGNIIVSTERMTAIEEIDELGSTATVQAGVVLQALQEAARERGLYFPIDLGARGSCTVGGNVSTNAGGINVIRYGMMRSRVLGLEAVLADGRVISSMNRMLKNNAGYDLKQLFIGTEGTLGIVTRVIVRLEEAPVSRSTAMITLGSFDDVVAVLKQLQRTLAGRLSAYEVMWGDHYRAVTVPGANRAPLPRDRAFYAVIETEGAEPESDEAALLAALEEATEAGRIQDAVVAHSEAERASLWKVREDFSEIYKTTPIFLYDVSLPIRHMEAYVADVLGRLQRRWPNGFCQVMGHVGDGNLHLFVHPAATGDHLHEKSDEDVYAALTPFGGSISAEHGIGTEKRGHLGISRSADEIALMRLLKQTLDPKGILNPGMVV